jgi:hypothetical protein
MASESSKTFVLWGSSLVMGDFCSRAPELRLLEHCLHPNPNPKFHWMPNSALILAI